MKEQDHRVVERQHDGWVPLKDMYPIDFWVGSQYLGNYNQRLQLDLVGIEKICRDNDFPPIILRSDSWNPPAARTPEMVAPGLSALKKTVFQRDPALPESDSEYYRLTATDERIAGKTFPTTPVGWNIYIKDRKLLYDYMYKHPNASKEQAEQYFVHGVDDVLRNALTDIALKEIFALRSLNTSGRYRHVGWNIARQIAAMLPGSFVSFKSFKAFIVTEFFDTALWQEIYKLAQIGPEYALTQRGDKKNNFNLKYTPYGDHRLASYIWRIRNFPERGEESEYHTVNIPKTLATCLLPGGLFLEQLYKTYFSLYQHKSSFVRLANQ